MRPPPEPLPPASAGPSPRPLPTREELRALDVEGFVRRLDDSARAISEQGTLTSLLPPEDLTDTLADPRFAGADDLLRKSLRGLLVATSLRDVPPEVSLHPSVQARLWSAMEEMDSAVVGVGDTLGTLTHEERVEIGRALRDEPDLAEQALSLLGTEAERAGVSDERRADLRRMGEHACFRLRCSTPAFIDEQLEKLAKTRPLPFADAERRLAARLGPSQFEREKDWHLAVSDIWTAILAEEKVHLASGDPSGAPGGISPDDAYAPPAGNHAPPPGPVDTTSGTKVLKVGAWLFGMASSRRLRGRDGEHPRRHRGPRRPLLLFTAAAVLSVAGIICLLVGAILRAACVRHKMRALGLTE
ncbi:MAG: hypothetical protein R3B70_00670 [Polyangiaceae bacterium]